MGVEQQGFVLREGRGPPTEAPLQTWWAIGPLRGRHLMDGRGPWVLNSKVFIDGRFGAEKGPRPLHSEQVLALPLHKALMVLSASGLRSGVWSLESGV